MLDLAPIRALLNIHMGRGASKAALHAHILAYEHLVPALLSELAATQAGPVVEWTTVGRSFVAVVGSMEMIVTPDDTPSVWSFGWQLSITGTHSSDPFCVILDSGTQTGDAGKAACIAAYRKAAGL